MEVSSLTPGRIEIRLLELVGCTATEALLAAAHYVWEWFDLDANLAPFYQLAMGDPVLTALGFQLTVAIPILAVRQPDASFSRHTVGTCDKVERVSAQFL
ncbi:hypothetical protein [Alicyclobacillus fastidiosus]|uniref:Uncharacterized protein n=1 Tax=Alicyclobacillus fastidiosus TaxID=392011 RepID=A0ABV5AKC7_9BACL|nr:hypothetical protein [Alicyclobacillus fastidiosus]WEH07804.1 hypothetical protein PYS47_13615 [Alicyclobacillus fastidiosus]